jgi:hypothetical protein
MPAPTDAANVSLFAGVGWTRFNTPKKGLPTRRSCGLHPTEIPAIVSANRFGRGVSESAVLGCAGAVPKQG